VRPPGLAATAICYLKVFHHTYCSYTYVYINIHTYVHNTYVRTYIHAYKHTHTHTRTYIHTYIYIHTYTHTCIHTYIHTYMHTYIHTHAQNRYEQRCPTRNYMNVPKLRILNKSTNRRLHLYFHQELTYDLRFSVINFVTNRQKPLKDLRRKRMVRGGDFSVDASVTSCVTFRLY